MRSSPRGILVIGDARSCPGGTKDKNIGFIAEIPDQYRESISRRSRVVADDEGRHHRGAGCAAPSLQLRPSPPAASGPTHDDITGDAVAKAFGVGIDHHPEVVARFSRALPGPGRN